MKIVYLTPKTSFRNRLRSDSLFGLILWGMDAIHGPERVEELIEAFVSGNPPFLLSSAFPFRTKKNERRLYFPKPIMKPLRSEATPETMTWFKEYKKVQWISEEIFSQFVKGEISEEDFFKQRPWKSNEKPWGKSGQIMHNKIDRISGTSMALFYTEEHFIRDGGLFFLLDIRDATLETQLKGVFQFFEHIGFGGDASTGKASFKFDIENFTPDWLAEDSKHKIALSLYFPKKDELNYFANHEADIWYRLELRKGKVGGRLFIQPNVWKKGVTVFKEGSIFPAIPPKKVYGAFPIVKEKRKALPFNVYYYGYPLMIGFNMKGN